MKEIKSYVDLKKNMKNSRKSYNIYFEPFYIIGIQSLFFLLMILSFVINLSGILVGLGIIGAIFGTTLFLNKQRLNKSKKNLNRFVKHLKEQGVENINVENLSMAISKMEKDVEKLDDSKIKREINSYYFLDNKKKLRILKEIRTNILENNVKTESNKKYLLTDEEVEKDDLPLTLRLKI